MSEKRTSKRTSKTPSKHKLGVTESTSPRELRTPSKAKQPGIPRVVFTHGTTLRSLINDWQRLRNRGTTICRSILALRLHECEKGEYPDRLRSFVESLAEATNGMQNIIDSMEIVDKQLEAVARLQPSEEAVLSWWSARKVATAVHDIYLSYQLEGNLKTYVTENIAHCRDERMSEVLASAWELEAHVEPARERCLFADLGLPASVT